MINAAPERIAQHCQRRSTGAIFLGRELAAHLRRDSQHTKEARSHALLLHVLNMPGCREIDTGRSAGINGCVQKGGVVADQFPSPAILPRLIAFHALLFKMGDDAGEARGLGIGERAEQGGIHDAEDGGVRADAKGQREDDDRGRGGAAAQHSQGVAEIHQDVHDCSFSLSDTLLCGGTQAWDARIHYPSPRRRLLILKMVLPFITTQSGKRSMETCKPSPHESW